ncbi:MAG: hypothetical protein Q8P59_02560, partial [Dehalococcoidia bacterium]|nr:hypothetical protein [Dehalococcoidia bacterium]
SLVRIKDIPLGRSEVFLLLYLLVPLTIVYLITARAPKFTERYLIMAAPAFYLLLARGLAFLLLQGKALLGEGKSRGRAFLAAFALGALGVLAPSGYFTHQILNSPDFARDNNRAAVAYIQANSRPGDVIVLMMNAPQAFQYYYKGDLPWYGLQPGDDFQAAAAELNRMTQGKERLWLFLWNSDWADPAGFIRDSLEEAAPRALPDQYFQGVEVRTYSLAARPHFTADFQPRYRLGLNFEGKVELLGYDPPKEAMSSGQESTLTLYWKALQPLKDDYVVSLRLKRGGYYWGDRQVRPTNYYYPTISWKVGLPIRGQVSIIPLPGTPPGQYQVEVAFHSLGASGSGRDLPILGPGGVPQGTSAILGTIDLGKAERPPSTDELGVAQTSPTPLSDEVSLLGANTAAQAVRPGDVVPLTLFWQAVLQPKEAYRVVVSLEDSKGKIRTLYENHPVGGAYPTDKWQAAEVVRDQYALSVPMEAAPGPASLRVALTAAGKTVRPAATVASLTIQERIRIMDRPEAIQRPLDANLGNIVRLVGYDLSSDMAKPGETLRLTLYWQALQESKTSYKVFTHLLGSQDKIWAQQDNPPVKGTYPMTAWARGEYIRDAYELVVEAGAPPGEYVLEVGMYDGPSGERLRVLGEGGKPQDNRVILVKVRIGP